MSQQRKRNNPRSSQQSQNDFSSMEVPSSSQKYSKHVQNASEKLSAEELSRKVSELVRYFIMHDKKKIPIRKQEINKSVMKEHAKAFPVIFEKAKAQLADIFGLNVVEAETAGKSKLYMLINTLENDNDRNDITWNQDANKSGLLMIILSLIYMSDDVVTEALLWRTLKQLGINKDKSHKEFGDVEKVLQDFVKKMYISREKVDTAEGPMFQYRWGLRSQKETTKRNVLQFVSNVYGIGIKLWKIQYREILAEENQSVEIEDE